MGQPLHLCLTRPLLQERFTIVLKYLLDINLICIGVKYYSIVLDGGGYKLKYLISIPLRLAINMHLFLQSLTSKEMTVFFTHAITKSALLRSLM